MSELSERNRIAAQEAKQRYYDRLLEADDKSRAYIVTDYRLTASRRARYRAAISFLQFIGVVAIGTLIVMGICLFGLGIGRLR